MTIQWLGGAVLNYAYNNIITHIPIHWIRLGFLRLLNGRIHPTAKVLMHVRILNFWKIELGARTVINQYCLLDCRLYRIKIKHDVDIGPYTRIWTLGHDPDSVTHEVKGGDVIVEDHVWIASGVTILPNVTIERGAVVGASSVVHKNIAQRCIMAGNPAKFVRERRNELLYQLKYSPFLE